MYDDLVKNLRNRRICVQSGGDLEKDFPLMKEAADAIEQLSKQLEYWELEASAQETDKNYRSPRKAKGGTEHEHLNQWHGDAERWRETVYDCFFGR